MNQFDLYTQVIDDDYAGPIRLINPDHCPFRDVIVMHRITRQKYRLAEPADLRRLAADLGYDTLKGGA